MKIESYESFGAYDDFCKSKKCEWYVEWQYTFDESLPPYPCKSCRLAGQSHNIFDYPKNCAFIDEIVKIGK